MLLLFFLTLAAAANALVIDYPASQMGLGWITIVLRARELVSVASVTWCRSTVPNGATPPPPDIAECAAPNLQHLQLYPSARPYLRYPAEAEPNTLYVDADDLGGWDLRHQFDIIISGDKGAFRQVVRFNALMPAPPTTIVSATAAEQTTEAQTTPLATTAQGPTAQDTSAPATSVDPITEPAPTFLPLPMASAQHPWLGSGVFLGAGLLVIALTALAIRWRQLRLTAPLPPPAAGAHTAYEWNDVDGVSTDSEGTALPAGAEVEMTEFSRDE